MLTIKEQYVFSMSKEHQPIISIPSGTTVCIETKDCFNNQITSEDYIIDELDWDHINPATGPIYIEEAKAGDVLKVEIKHIQLGKEGTMCAIPDNGVLGNCVQHSSIKKIPIQNDSALFDNITLPLNPMIGVIGVAPNEGDIPCGTPGNHGGNMDNTKITTGSTLYLPIFHDGALFSLGDVHACMGDGEIMVSGVEIPAQVTVTLSVIKNISINDPLLIDNHHIYTIASDESLDLAIYKVTHTMNQIIQHKLHYDLNTAGMLMSACGNVEICQVVDPKKTVRFAMPRYVFEQNKSNPI